MLRSILMLGAAGALATGAIALGRLDYVNVVHYEGQIHDGLVKVTETRTPDNQLYSRDIRIARYDRSTYEGEDMDGDGTWDRIKICGQGLLFRCHQISRSTVSSFSSDEIAEIDSVESALDSALTEISQPRNLRQFPS